MKDDVCRIPVSATVEIIGGEAVMTSAEYADIPADTIAHFLIEKFGITPILGGGESDAAGLNIEKEKTRPSRAAEYV